MRYVRLALLVGFMLAVSSVAGAADWTTEDGGTDSCKVVKPDGVCYLTAIAADSSAVNIRQCPAFSVTVYGTGASIMPQTCTDSTCATAEDLLSAVLTGDSPNAFVTSEITFDFIRIDWTAGGAAPTVVIKCGR